MKVRFAVEVGAIALMFTGLVRSSVSGWFVRCLARRPAGPVPALSIRGPSGCDHPIRRVIPMPNSGPCFRESGGAVRYGHYSHGSLVGLVAGWAAWIAIVSVYARWKLKQSVQYMSSMAVGHGRST